MGEPTDCGRRDCGGTLEPAGDDPLLPGYLQRYECDTCGEWWLYDRQDETVEIDA